MDNDPTQVHDMIVDETLRSIQNKKKKKTETNTYEPLSAVGIMA